jgi:integrase/recombinase XerD
MSIRKTIHGPWIERLEDHLEVEKYSSSATEKRLAAASQFLVYLRGQRTGVEVATVAHLRAYLEHRLRLYRKRHGRLPRDTNAWRWDQTGGIHKLLQLAQGKWPPAPEPVTPQEKFRWELCDAYGQWLSESRGLASGTIHNRRAEALRFLESSRNKAISSVTISDVDNHIKSRAPQLQRTTRHRLVSDLRSFLRYLYARGETTRDLSCPLVGTRRYAFEGIPPALRAEHIDAVLRTTRRDHTAKGLRDYAILMLLSTYGLRAGEVTSLRLDDIDWRADQLHIRHSKTGVQSLLPLLAPVGEAILKYLRRGRPNTKVREVFLRARAPFKPYRTGSSLYHMVERRLQGTGITLDRKHGPHAFRHARAVSLLHAAVPMKSIGDVLGHRSADSTAVYLKLATSELRGVGLEIPMEVRR